MKWTPRENRLIFSNKTGLMHLFLTIVIFFTALCSGFGDSEYDKEKIRLIEESYKKDIPIWLLMERGREAYELGEYGLAARVFREVVSRENISPDAELWLGMIFEQEGEYPLAEKQYLKVLENKNQLYLIEDEFTVLSKLTGIYERTNQYGKYEKTLLTVLEKDPNYRDNLKLLYAMNDVLKERGLDKLFELYRFKDNKFNKTRIDLGILYYRTGRYSEAEINLTVAMMSVLTTGFDYLNKKTAVYEYANFNEHLNAMVNEPILKEYVDSNNLFMILYYLAASLYADGYNRIAVELWTAVIEHAEPGNIWSIRSGRQLQSPFIEPIITYRS